MDGSRLKDKRNIQDMLDKFDLLSINQTLAQIKLQETWKANKDPDFPIKMTNSRMVEENGRLETLRTTTKKSMREGCKTQKAGESFVRDAGKLWNQAPRTLKKHLHWQ